MSQSDLPNFLVVPKDRKEKREKKENGAARIGDGEKKSLSLLGRERERLPENLENYCRMPPLREIASSRYDEKRGFLSEKEARVQLPRAARQMSEGYEEDEHERRQKFASNQESFDSIIPSIGKYCVARSIRREKRLIRDCQARFSRRNLIRL